MPVLGYPVCFKKSSGLFQGSRNVRVLSIMFSSEPSLKYLGPSTRVQKEKCSLQRSACVCVHMHIGVCMSVCGLLVLGQVPAMRYSA